ncbi:MAG: hypothetical protein RL148_1600 [Planctomycetota bacterium]|jgi:uncharacterized membrane protein
MKLFSRLFLRGLAAVLPVVLTVYLVWIAVSGVENLLRELIKSVFPGVAYWPGMGFAVSVLVVLAAGMLMYTFVARTLYRWLTELLGRIPVVKSVYGMVLDVVNLFGGNGKKPFQKVVLVRLEPAGAELLGFVTREDCADLPGFGADRVAVYLPMSYQLGGFTVMVPRAQVREVPMGAEEALRFCVTAGVKSQPAVAGGTKAAG